MKTKLLIISLIILSFFIYKISYKRQLYLLALGDGSCLATSVYGVKGYSYNNYLSEHLDAKLVDKHCQKDLRIEDLYLTIKNNKEYILRELDKSDYITIMIGYDELMSYKQVSNTIKRDFLDNYNKLLKIIRKNTKAKIFVLGFYSSFFTNIKDINQKLKIITNNNDATFVDLSEIPFSKDNFYDIRSYNLNRNGNKLIFNKIKEFL